MMIPAGVDLKTWSASLIIDFPNDNIPNLYDNSSWREWGDSLSQENSFSANHAPTTESYKDWESWATDVYSVMTNFS